MKKTYIYSVIVFISLLFFSCKKMNLLTFPISYSTDFTVSSGFPINLPFDIPTPNVTTNSTSEFESNKTAANLVKDVYLDYLRLSISSPQGKNFDFLKSIHLYISLNGTNEVEIAYLDNIPKGVTTINLTPTKAKLDKYIKESSFNLRARATTREILTQDVTIMSNMRFIITADPL